ncbi:venom carboxylesterase-6 [Bombus terrestris]|uniref:Carboxylic ester hydrolase n=1 Tax=Bombus terrestris TaxID=30195 RepID=A0A9C6SKH6_BOMTE|nr:venom carboxylesterase-6 [Bombus terrestris]
MELSVIALLLLGFVNFSWQNEQAPRVKTSLGDIRGYYKISRHGRKYEAYEGIPYAQPPIGNLRFKPPQPVQEWINELPAVEKGPVCTQYVVLSTPQNRDKVTGCEDCLYMNIYVPFRNGNESLLPVMFWIHGGAYQFGSGNKVNETLVMDRDVILVTFNYRLASFGFLSTGDSVVPGNMGLKDQNVALRWVHNHIRSFGGDPNQITIFGLSAGASSVHYHYLSRLSAGLFQRGISISGVALDPWAQTKYAPEKARRFAATLGCPTRNTKEMIDCLQTRPARILSQATGEVPDIYAPFGPVVDKYGPDPFITRSPIDIIVSGEAYDVPWISGVVSEEGLYISAAFVGNDQLLKQLNDDWDNIAPYLLDYNDTLPLNQHKEVAEKIRKYYLGSNPIDSNTSLSVTHMIGDRMFSVDFQKAAILKAKINKSPVWTYYYSYRSMHSCSEIVSGGSTKNFVNIFLLNSPDGLGVSHGDDAFLVLDTRISNVSRPNDLEMQQILLDFYTSFAIEGKPRAGDVQWQTLDPNEKEFQYLHIANPQNIKMETSSDFANINFWNTIDFNENKISGQE